MKLNHYYLIGTVDIIDNQTLKLKGRSAKSRQKLKEATDKAKNFRMSVGPDKISDGEGMLMNQGKLKQYEGRSSI